jgi:putative Mn2+ efflux pump MntP
VLFLILISILLNIDTLAVGMSYGFRKKNISIMLRIIISIISTTIMLAIMIIGHNISIIFPEYIVKFIGIFIISLTGIYLIYESIKNKNIQKEKENINDATTNKLSSGEAFAMSIALSTDSVGVGIGLSLLNLNILLFPLITFTLQYTFLSLGLIIGKQIATDCKIHESTFTLLSGVLLIIIAFIKIF